MSACEFFFFSCITKKTLPFQNDPILLNSERLHQSSGREKEIKIVVLCLRPKQKVKLGTFTSHSRAVTANKFMFKKKRGASGAKFLFC